MPVRVDPADWKRVLAKVTGRFVRGQHRVSTCELLERLGVPFPRVIRQSRLRPIMHELGWHGPQMLRFDKKTLNGYWRPPTVGGVFSPDVGDFDFAADALAAVEDGSVGDLPALAEAKKCNDADVGASAEVPDSKGLRCQSALKARIGIISVFRPVSPRVAVRSRGRAMTTDNSYDAWLRANPAPDLQAHLPSSPRRSRRSARRSCGLRGILPIDRRTAVRWRLRWSRQLMIGMALIRSNPRRR